MTSESKTVGEPKTVGRKMAIMATNNPKDFTFIVMGTIVSIIIVIILLLAIFFSDMEKSTINSICIAGAAIAATPIVLFGIKKGAKGTAGIAVEKYDKVTKIINENTLEPLFHLKEKRDLLDNDKFISRKLYDLKKRYKTSINADEKGKITNERKDYIKRFIDKINSAKNKYRNSTRVIDELDYMLYNMNSIIQATNLEQIDTALDESKKAAVETTAEVIGPSPSLTSLTSSNDVKSDDILN